MLSLWQFTGFPTTVTSDNAGNFTAHLTREFLKRVGCSPIWCTPRHPHSADWHNYASLGPFSTGMGDCVERELYLGMLPDTQVNSAWLYFRG